MSFRHVGLSLHGEIILCDHKNMHLHFLSPNALPLRSITTPFMPMQAAMALSGEIWVQGERPLFVDGRRTGESGVFILSPDGTVLKFIKRTDPNDFDGVMKIVPMQNGNVVVTNLDDHFISVFDPTGERLWHSTGKTSEDYHVYGMDYIGSSTTATISGQSLFISIFTSAYSGAIFKFSLEKPLATSDVEALDCPPSDCYRLCSGIRADPEEGILILADNRNGPFFSIVDCHTGKVLFRKKTNTLNGFGSHGDWCLTRNGIAYSMDRYSKILYIY